MLQPPKMVSYQASDLTKAREWYASILGYGPAFDSPMACVFAVGGSALSLLPRRNASDGLSGGVAFWEVEDIDVAYGRLLEAGAEPVTEITLLMMRSRVARVRDPFGNVIGLFSASTKKTAVEGRPSESALTVAFCRALATYEESEEIRGRDTLATLFVAEESKPSLGDPAARRWLAEKFAGTYEYFIGRTAYGDAIYLEALRERVPQIAFLGAGYDTRAYRFRAENEGTRVFELDAPPTQHRKRRLLEQAGHEKPPEVVFVPVNFETRSVGDALTEAGYDPGQKTLFIWEGVTYYLSEDAVEATLAFVRDGSAPGSTLCFDYMIQAPDLEERHGVKAVLGSWRQAYSAEHVQFGIEEGTIAAFLSHRGLRLIEDLAPVDVERRFLTRRDGSRVGRVVGLFHIARAMTGL